MIELVIIKFVLAGFVLFAVLNLAGFHTWVERKQSALIQDRIGANRASIFGFRALGLFHGMVAGRAVRGAQRISCNLISDPGFARS